jgi:hypothetical protein
MANVDHPAPFDTALQRQSVPRLLVVVVGLLLFCGAGALHPSSAGVEPVTSSEDDTAVVLVDRTRVRRVARVRHRLLRARLLTGGRTRRPRRPRRLPSIARDLFRGQFSPPRRGPPRLV